MNCVNVYRAIGCKVSPGCPVCPFAGLRSQVAFSHSKGVPEEAEEQAEGEGRGHGETRLKSERRQKRTLEAGISRPTPWVCCQKIFGCGELRVS